MTKKPQQIKKDPKTGRFLPGNRAGGRPPGARQQLARAFTEEMAKDFENHGVKAIQQVREERPHEYLKVIAQMLPKDVNLNVNKFDEMTDDDVYTRIQQLDKLIRPYLAGHTGRESGAGGGTSTPHTIQ